MSASAVQASSEARLEDVATSAQPDRTPVRGQQLALDLFYSAALIGLLLSYRLWPKGSGGLQRQLGATLIATLLPLALLVLLSLIERLFTPAGPRKSLKTWFLHLHINIMLSLASGFAVVYALLWSKEISRYCGFELGLIDLRLGEGKGLLALLGGIWIATIVGEFFVYWYHRLEHAVPFLWQVHKLHHMDRELDVLTRNRHSWVEAFFGGIVTAVLVSIFFKFDSGRTWELGLIGGSIITLFKLLLSLGHMNVRLQIGWAALFYCSPQVHRIHHSRLPQHADKNFSDVFPLWDMLFGTYYAPARDEFPPTGLAGEKDVGSLWEAQTLALRGWWQMFRSWRARRNGTAV